MQAAGCHCSVGERDSYSSKDPNHFSLSGLVALRIVSEAERWQCCPGEMLLCSRFLHRDLVEVAARQSSLSSCGLCTVWLEEDTDIFQGTEC